MFPIQLRIIEITGGAWLSFEINRDGIFLFAYPVELALLWPWTKV